MIRRTVRSYLALHPKDRRLLMRAMIELTVFDVALRVMSLRRLVGSQAEPAPTGVVGVDVVQKARRYAFWIDVASKHHFVRAKCLHRSLVLHRWLGAQGVPSVLRIGVQKDGSVLNAHAWVEIGGEVVNDRPDAVAGFALLRAAGTPEVDSAGLSSFAGN